jgi:hypothetical protein
VGDPARVVIGPLQISDAIAETIVVRGRIIETLDLLPAVAITEMSEVAVPAPLACLGLWQLEEIGCRSTLAVR